MVTRADHFIREFRTKNWTTAQILTILKRTDVETYNSAKDTIFWFIVC